MKEEPGAQRVPPKAIARTSRLREGVFLDIPIFISTIFFSLSGRHEAGKYLLPLVGRSGCGHDGTR